MRPIRTVVSATLTAAVLVGVSSTTPVAQASDGDIAINGTYAAISDGFWATTDFAFQKQATVRSTWTITSTCTGTWKCTGQVSSDHGWSAPLYTDEASVWYVKRDLPNWQTCPDGTAFAGHQTFKFWPASPDGLTKIGSPYLEGKDKTTGETGACGRFKFLTIVMPFRLDKIG